MLVGAALLLLAVGLWRRHQDPFEVRPMLQHPSAAPVWTPLASRAFARLTPGTKFQGRWQINRPPRPGWVTLVLADSAAPGATIPKRYIGNCTYVGRDGLMVCDINLVRRFLTERGLDKRASAPVGDDHDPKALRSLTSLPDASVQAADLDMLTWVVGHELGHVAAGHGASHFTHDRLDDPVAAASIDQAKELQADGFLVSRLPDVNGRDMEFYQFLIGVEQSEINRKACPDRSPAQYCPNLQVGVLIFSPNDVLRYSKAGTHPEYLVRMVRLLELADRRYNLGIVGPLNREIRDKLVAEGRGAR